MQTDFYIKMYTIFHFFEGIFEPPKLSAPSPTPTPRLWGYVVVTPLVLGQ